MRASGWIYSLFACVAGPLFPFNFSIGIASRCVWDTPCLFSDGGCGLDEVIRCFAELAREMLRLETEGMGMGDGE